MVSICWDRLYPFLMLTSSFEYGKALPEVDWHWGLQWKVWVFSIHVFFLFLFPFLFLSLFTFPFFFLILSDVIFLWLISFSPFIVIFISLFPVLSVFIVLFFRHIWRPSKISTRWMLCSGWQTHPWDGQSESRKILTSTHFVCCCC